MLKMIRLEHPDIAHIMNTGYGWDDPREQEGEEEAGRDGNPTFPGFFGKCNQRAGAVEGE